MPKIDLSYVNIALDAFGLVVVLIIAAACIGERIQKRGGSTHFLVMLAFIAVALTADIVCWFGEGHVQFRVMTVISNTVSNCALQLSVMLFMEYLCDSLYINSKTVSRVLKVFKCFCTASLLLAIGNAFFGYAFTVNSTGNYVPSGNIAMTVLYFLFLIAATVALIVLAIMARNITGSQRIAFLAYTIFFVVGSVMDCVFCEISLTYISMVISVLVIYTHIYLQKQKLIDEQRNALMLSQINPHFIYNTLSAIAAMCDISPKLAKGLTVDFSRYLRQNLNSLTCESLIPFAQELEHVKCYLSIEQARFRERLRVIYSVQCDNFSIPPLTVQPIVENAVKHGITQKPVGGTVKIASYSTDSGYVVEIIDDGIGFDAETLSDSRGNHIGIENVNIRLKRMCKGTLSINSEPGIGTRVTIEIPRGKGAV